MQLQFLGATGTVTGSKYLLRHEGATLLVDCGLFQGYKQLRLRIWAPMLVPAVGIDAIVLTHAHIDHSGYVPLLARQGFEGKVYCSQATYELCRILLPDSGHLQEEEAEYANRRGYSKHKPALPLYTRGRRALPEAVRAPALRHPMEPGTRAAGTPGPVGAHARLRLREDRRWSALDPVLRRHRSSERLGAGRAGTRPGCRLRRGRVDLRRPPA